MGIKQKVTVFSIRADEWQVKIGDKVLPTIWNSKGAAQAGAQVELRRMKKKSCKPE